MKIKRTDESLLQSLKDQYSLLSDYCDQYDQGKHYFAKPISTCLRVLFNETKQSKSLLGQLNIRNIRWLNTSHQMYPDNEVSECGLMVMQFGPGDRGVCLPICKTEYDAKEFSYRPFVKWFNDPIILDATKRKYFNRREIIAYIANTDGGAHIDPETDVSYESIKRRVFIDIPVVMGPNGKEVRAEGNIPEICMREIGFEVLKTLESVIKEI